MYATTIMETSLALAWQRAIEFVSKSPEKIKFGGGKEVKHATDSQTTILLDSNAVNEALAGMVHPLDPFCTPYKLPVYKSEYTESYPHENHDYTYYGRLSKGFKTPLGRYLNQIGILRDGLQKQIDEGLSSNRNIAILFNPEIENFSGKSTPCWNEVLIRLLDDHNVSIHLTFRSHDLWGAWEGNMCSILEFLNRDVVAPCGCSIKWVQEVNYSLHIYDSDMDAAIKVINSYKTGRRPDLRARQEKYNRIAGGLYNA